MIGKKRHDTALDIEEVFDPAAGRVRGVLKPVASAGKFRHSRRSPSPELAHCIDHYWMVRWDLRGHEPHVQETLPHPNVYLIFESGNLSVAGVSTTKFTRVLEGQSYAFGVKFTPGGFHPFLNDPVSSLTDRTMAANRIFGNDADVLQAMLVSSGTDDEMMEAADSFFRSRAPAREEKASLAARLVERILKEPELRTVAGLADRTGMGERSLQRLFNEYVGIHPKWVIRRYRLHELIERLNAGECLDWADLASELGYFDQAHLINDFRSIMGYSPTHYPASGQ
ncbi:MAG: DUF6597 domain-containing transcriptional factor [Acidobacteriaceae bacterium]